MEIESLSRRLLSLSLFLPSLSPLALSFPLSALAALPWRPLWHSLFHLHRHSTFSSSSSCTAFSPFPHCSELHHHPSRRRTASASPPVRSATPCLPACLPPSLPLLLVLRCLLLRVIRCSRLHSHHLHTPFPLSTANPGAYLIYLTTCC